MLIPTITNLSQDEMKLLMILRSMHPLDTIEIRQDKLGKLTLFYTQKESYPFLTGRGEEDTMSEQ